MPGNSIPGVFDFGKILFVRQNKKADSGITVQPLVMPDKSCTLAL